MKWYKRDPVAALEGMLGLSIEERGAYNTILDLLYARDGKGVTDYLVTHALGCNPRTWRRLKSALVGKGKISEQGANITATRVERELNEARMRLEQTSNARARAKEIKNLSPQSTVGQPQPQPQPEKKKEREPRAKRAASPKVLLPIDWAPSWQLSDEEKIQLPRFADDALAHSRRYANWDAAFRNWVRRQPEFQRNGGQSGGRVVSGTGLFSAEAVAERAWRRQRSGSNRSYRPMAHESPREEPSKAVLAGGAFGERLRSLERSAVPENAGDNRVGKDATERDGDDAGMHKTG